VIRYLVRRLAVMPLILLGIVTITFFASRVVGDPIASIVGFKALNQPDVVAAAEAKWGLDGSVFEQYAKYLGNLAQGDFGTSFATRRPVLDDVMERFPATVELTVVAMVIGGVGGVGLGLLAASRRGRVSDVGIRMFSLVGSSVPVFWTGMILLSVFYARLGWLPGPGRLGGRTRPPPEYTGMYTVDALMAGDLALFREACAHLVLPAVVLGWALIGSIARTVRATALDELHADYVRTARAKGLRDRTVFARHVLRNAMLPVLTLLGLSFAALLTGAALVESVYEWNGIGSYAVDASRSLDFPAVYGTAILGGLVFLLVNLATDLLYSFVDPKVRLS
jgi:ABC-type dipeptide/oligopeptide/nickel transport system permease component